MPTRFYLSNAAPSYTPASPAFRGTWDLSTATTIRALTARPSGATTTTSVAVGSTASSRKVLVMRGITEPATTAGTISGTMQWVLGVLESNTGLNGFFMVHVWVSVGDSSTVRGTLLSMSQGATEFPTTYAGRSDGSKALTSVAIQAGDRIVVELGYICLSNATATTYTGTYRYGGTSATDLAAAGTDTTQPPWIEFSDAEGLFSRSVSSIVSDFSSTIPSTLNSSGNVAPAITGGRLRLTATGTDDYTNVQTNVPVQLDTDGFYVEVPTVLASTGATTCYMDMSILDVVGGGGKYIGFIIDTLANPDTIGFFCWDNYYDPSQVTLTYDPVAHRWVRLRRSGNSVLWDTSPDGVTWTNRRTLATPPSWVNYTNLAFLLEAYKDGASSSFAEFDNLNIVAVSLELDRPIGDTVSVGEAVARVVLRPRGIADTVAVAEALARVAARARGLTDTATVADSAGRLSSRSRSLADTVAAVDDVARMLGRFRTIADTTTVADSVARMLARPRSTGDAATLADAAARLMGVARPAADTTALVDALGVLRHPARMIADTVTVADSLVRAPLARARALADTAAVADSVARAGSRVRLISDVAGLADAVAARIAAARGLADAVLLADALNSGGSPVRTTADTVVFADEGLFARGVGRDAVDFVYTTDGVAITGSVLSRTGADAVGVAEDVLRELALIGAAAETLGLADAAARSGGGIVYAGDTVDVADLAAATSVQVRAVAELLALADEAVSGQLNSTQIGDAVTVADAAARGATGYARLLADGLGLADDAGTGWSAARTVAAALTLGDEALLGRLFSTQLGDTVHLVDEVLSSLGKGALPVDSVTLVDQVARARVMERAGSDSLFIGDIAVRDQVLARLLTDLVRAADQGRAATGRSRGAADLLHLVDVGFAVVTGPVPILIVASHSVRMSLPPQSVQVRFPTAGIRRTQ